jgi:hypothetical protein
LVRGEVPMHRDWVNGVRSAKRSFWFLRMSPLPGRGWVRVRKL